MQAIHSGDEMRVHFVKRSQTGGISSSRRTSDRFVEIDTNHPYAGQAMVLGIQILQVAPCNTVPMP
jgi:FKBP-type peptidyl-prolyl cis-trans isomerase 2